MSPRERHATHDAWSFPPDFVESITSKEADDEELTALQRADHRRLGKAWSGTPPTETYWKYRRSSATFYQWQPKCDGVGISRTAGRQHGTPDFVCHS